MTISEILKSINKTDYDALMTAFEGDISLYVEYKPDKWVGVNMNLNVDSDELQVEEQVGFWSAGSLKKGINEKS